jgi:hypothetical protein
MHRARKEAHRPGEAETSEPPHHLLRAMREENNSQNEPQNGSGGVIFRGKQFVNHLTSLLSTVPAAGPVIVHPSGLSMRCDYVI